MPDATLSIIAALLFFVYYLLFMQATYYLLHVGPLLIYIGHYYVSFTRSGHLSHSSAWGSKCVLFAGCARKMRRMKETLSCSMCRIPSAARDREMEHFHSTALVNIFCSTLGKSRVCKHKKTWPGGKADAPAPRYFSAWPSSEPADNIMATIGK